MTKWKEDAACRTKDPAIFFPDGHSGGRPRSDGTQIKMTIHYGPALTICEDCPVKLHCLKFALETNERHGVWGGMTPNQRRDLGATKRKRLLERVKMQINAA
jgi:WhiB family redox-sensing transcriptional regulator